MHLSMYRVTTGSRLHFGLIALEPDAHGALAAPA